MDVALVIRKEVRTIRVPYVVRGSEMTVCRFPIEAAAAETVLEEMLQSGRGAKYWVAPHVEGGEGKGAGLVLPSCDSEAMARHLEVAPGAHAILLLDQAGWHVSKKLPIPDNITLLPFPSKSPELNPIENIWQFMPDNWL